MNTWFLVAGLLVLLVPTFGQAEEPSIDELTQQTNQYLATFQEELNKEDYKTAAAALRKAAEIERQILRRAEKDIPDNTETLNTLRNNLRSALNWLAERDLARGDYESAIQLRQEILALTLAMNGENNWHTTDARLAVTHLQQIAKLKAEQLAQLSKAGQMDVAVFNLFGQGKYQEAIKIAVDVVTIRSRVLGFQHPHTASSLNNLAELYRLASDYAKALPLYEQSLEIRRKVLGQRHPDTATSLNNLALLHESMGEYAKALPLYEQSLEIKRNALGPQHPDTATSLNNLADLYQSMGDYDKALPLFQQSLEIRSKVFGEEHPHTASSLNNLAELYRVMGDYAKALPLYQQSLEIRRTALGPQHPNTATTLNNLALLYQSMGDCAKALPLYQQSLEIRRKVHGEEHSNTAQSFNNLGGLHQIMGDYVKALPLYRQSLEINRKVLGEEHPSYVLSLNNLAALHQLMGDYDKALPIYQQSLDINKKTLGPQHPTRATSLNNLAVLYGSMGDYAKALPIYQQSLGIRRKTLGTQHPDTAVSLNNLADLHTSMGDYAKAETLMQRALHSTRASLEATALTQSERQQLAMAEGLRYQLDSYLSLASVSNQFQEQAYRELLAWKGATLVRQRQMRKVAENTEVAPLFKELQQTATRLATLSRMTPDPKQQVSWRRQITDLTAEKERLEAELSQKSSEFREAKKQVTLEDLLVALPKDAALVDYFEYWRKNTDEEQDAKSVRSLLAFVIRHDTPITLLDLGPVAPVSESIDIWRETFGTSRDGSAAGRLLRETVWTPVEKHLADTKLILVSADGALGRLPIGALPGKETGNFLLEEYRLAMLPVPQLLPALVAQLGRKELSGGLLLMGDVNYDADPTSKPDKKTAKSWKRSNTSLVRGGTHFSALTATAGEVATIKEVFTELFEPDPSQIKTLKQAAATEQAFRESAPHFYNLHLATHGFFAQADKKSALTPDAKRREQLSLSSERDQIIRGYNPGLLSGLAFSGANRKPELDKDDGILTADEIASLSLDGVNLVVLSACETGLGEVAGGEGLLGVQRAFQVSGVSSTVASLWEVGDIATRRLMERFYRNYWEKEMGKLDALREAQLYLLHHPEAIRGDSRVTAKNSKEPKRLSPQFWAAFQLSGDWR